MWYRYFCGLSFVFFTNWSFADSMASQPVYIPGHELGIDVAGRALYLQVSPNGRHYQYNGTNPKPSVLGANPHWGYGFELESAFHFSSANDINLNWYHYQHQDNQISSPQTYSNIILSDHYSQPSYANTYVLDESQEQLQLTWDQVNLEFGKHMMLGQYDDIRFQGGVSFARVANHLSAFSRGQKDASTFENTANMTTSFQGFGLRLGMDLKHDWNNGLVIYANAASSLLAGRVNSKHQLNAIINNISYSSENNANPSRVVPAADGRLGISYTYEMVQGDMVFDGGWLWVNYFNILDNDAQNIGVQGGYFGLKWIGHLA